MTVKEAYKLAKSKLKILDFKKCYEYEDLFVFIINPEGFDGMLSVNKKTGHVKNFRPFDISVEDYRSGKEIKQFK